MALDHQTHGSPDEPETDADPTSQKPPMSDSRQDSERSPAASSTKEHTESATKRANAKDPSRPRRKKARRACFACQRAHLTCGMSVCYTILSL